MDYTLPRLRAELIKAAEKVLWPATVAVNDNTGEVKADLAIPVFAAAAELDRPPAELADKLATTIQHDLIDQAQPSGGYVNIWLNSAKLASAVLAEASRDDYGRNHQRAGQTVLVEHTDPNPFKELHIGHLYSNTVGEAICRLFEASGAQVHRISYHGDVGLHIAQAVWAMGQKIDWQSERIDEIKRSTVPIGQYYAEGSRLYDQNKAAIEDVNRKIYSAEDKLINELYNWGSELSFQDFDKVFERVGVGFDVRLKESQSAPKGLELVKANTPGVFKENGGAVVYEGEAEGLHTRVFINSQGLPTYEAKDLGLMQLKDEMYPKAAKSIILTANEIDAYFKVVLASMAKIKPELADKTVHLSHGLVKLPEGKMSSRTGNVVLAEELLDQVEELVKQRSPQAAAVKDNTLAAIKYAFLRHSIGGDIVYDLQESIGLEGQTGPYVQYAAVRIQSILAKVQPPPTAAGGYDWQAEKGLLLLLARYPEVSAQAAEELAPHRIAQYVYELAKEFNRYYENNPVKDAEPAVRTARLWALKACLNVLSSGLELMNIPRPERM